MNRFICWLRGHKLDVWYWIDVTNGTYGKDCVRCDKPVVLYPYQP